MSDAGATLGRELRRPRIQVPTRYATVISVTPATGTATVRPSTASLTDGSQDIPAKYLSATAPAVGALVRLEVYQGDVLIIGAVGVDDYPGQPFAQAVGQQSITCTAALNSGLVAITFPAGRFTVAPRVVATVEDTTVGAWAVASSITNLGANLTLHLRASGTSTRAVTWHALQMTSTTANG